MVNEQTIHTQLRQAHEKKLSSLNTERTLLHSNLDTDADDALLVFTTDEHGHVVQPGDGLMLLIYSSDRIKTMSAAKLHPITDNFILPTERLHDAP